MASNFHSTALQALRSLETLAVSHNLIDDDGLAALAAPSSPGAGAGLLFHTERQLAHLASATEMTALTLLDLSNNMIGQGGLVQMHGCAYRSMRMMRMGKRPGQGKSEWLRACVRWEMLQAPFLSVASRQQEHACPPTP